MLLASRVSLIFILAVLFSYLGCNDPPLPEHIDAGEKGDRSRTFLIGLVPEQNVFVQKKRYQVLCDYLTEKLGVRFETRLLPSYGRTYHELLEGRVDGAFLGSYSSAMALKLLPTEVLVRPVWRDGTSFYRGLIIARRDAGIGPDVRTWKGRSMALVDPHTSAGYLCSLDLLRNIGVGRPEDFFSRVKFLGSHDAVALAVFEGRFDLGACKDSIFSELKAVRPEMDQMDVLAVSEKFPSNGLVVRDDLPPGRIHGLRRMLLAMHEDPEGRRVLEAFGAREFIKANAADYHPVFEIMDRLNLSFAPDAGADEVSGRGS